MVITYVCFGIPIIYFSDSMNGFRIGLFVECQRCQCPPTLPPSKDTRSHLKKVLRTAPRETCLSSPAASWRMDYRKVTQPPSSLFEKGNTKDVLVRPAGFFHIIHWF